MRWFAVLLVTCCSLPAQDSPGRLLQVDRVVATVNDSAILLSDLRRLAAGQIAATEQRLGRPLAPAESNAILARVLAPLIEKHALAQAAKNFDYMPASQVEALFQSEMSREANEQIRDLGTEQAFAAELANSGHTWQSYTRERRVDKMQDMALQLAMNARFAQHHNLLVTPRMMKEQLAAQRHLFEHGPRAELAWVTFQGPNAREEAGRAAELWRAENLTAQQVADRFQAAKATAQVGLRVTDETKQRLDELLVQFALGNPAGTVSPPLRLGGDWRVLRILETQAARTADFADPELQATLRNLCMRAVLDDYKQQATARAMRRTESWSILGR
ncbi:MAG: hypothetical protein JNK49_20065 [Planctomycetes bacterium]|nr:hypothetical protein [Planctomycetota bacterium]